MTRCTLTHVRQCKGTCGVPLHYTRQHDGWNAHRKSQKGKRKEVKGKERLRTASKIRLWLGGMPNACDTTLMQYAALGYSKTIENTITGLTIGGQTEQVNIEHVQCSSPQHYTKDPNSTRPIEPDWPLATWIKPNTKMRKSSEEHWTDN